MILKQVQHAGEPIAMDKYVGVDESEDSAARLAGSFVARASWPTGWRRESDNLVCLPRDLLCLGVVAAVVGDDQLPSRCGKIAVAKSRDAASEITRRAVRRHDYAELGESQRVDGKWRMRRVGIEPTT